MSKDNNFKNNMFFNFIKLIISDSLFFSNFFKDTKDSKDFYYFKVVHEIRDFTLFSNFLNWVVEIPKEFEYFKNNIKNDYKKNNIFNIIFSNKRTRFFFSNLRRFFYTKFLYISVFQKYLNNFDNLNERNRFLFEYKNLELEILKKRSDLNLKIMKDLTKDNLIEINSRNKIIKEINSFFFEGKTIKIEQLLHFSRNRRSEFYFFFDEKFKKVYIFNLFKKKIKYNLVCLKPLELNNLCKNQINNSIFFKLNIRRRKIFNMLDDYGYLENEYILINHLINYKVLDFSYFQKLGDFCGYLIKDIIYCDFFFDLFGIELFEFYIYPIYYSYFF